MKKTFRNVALFSLMLTLAQPLLTGCKDYDGDISNLQEQITSSNGDLAKLESTLSSQLSSANTLANTAQTLADQAQASAEAAAQQAKSAGDEAQKALLAAQAANDFAESAKQEAIAQAAADLAAEISKVQDQITANGKTAADALAATVANAQNISSVEGKLSTLQDYVNGLNILSAADVTSMINSALKEAGLDGIPAQVTALNTQVEGLAKEQQDIKTQLATLAGYESRISALETQVGDLKTLVNSLQSQMGTYEGQLDELEAALKVLINANTEAIEEVAKDLAAQGAKITSLNTLVLALQAELEDIKSNGLTEEDVRSLIEEYLAEGDYVTNGWLETTLRNFVSWSSLTDELENYITSEEFNTAIANYVTSASLEDLIKNYSTTTEMQTYVAEQIANAITASENKTDAAIQDYLKNYVSTSTYTTGINNLQNQINTINTTVGDIKEDVASIQGKITAINSNLLTLQTDMLRGLIFYTDVYVGGIPALDYQVVNYGQFAFATANNTVTASLIYPNTYVAGSNTTSPVTVPTATSSNPIYTAANTANPIVTEYFYPELIAQYTLNPSTAVIDNWEDQLSIWRRGVTVRADEDQDILGELSIEDASIANGMLTLNLQYTKPSLPGGTTITDQLSGNHFANPHNSMLFALQAEFEVGEGDDAVENTVTSDWGLFNPVSVTLSEGAIVYANPVETNIKPIDNPDYVITLNQGLTSPVVNQKYYPLYYTDLANVSNAATSVAGLTDALNNAPTLALPYTETMNLDEQVLVAFTMENQNDKSTTSVPYYFQMTPAELSEYGMTMNYELINYTVSGVTYEAGHTAGESTYATLDGSVLTPNPQTNLSLGHMPVVMCYVTDTHGDLLALAFVKVIISLPPTEAPVISTIDLGVYPYYPTVKEQNVNPLNYVTLTDNAAADPGMTITSDQWIKNYGSTAPTITANPAVSTDYSSCFAKDANGNITCTLQTYEQYTDIWQAENHYVTFTLVYEPNVSNLPKITIPVKVTVARPQVSLGEKLPNWWWNNETFAISVLPVQNSGTIGTTANTFSSILPNLFNNKQVLEYGITPIPTTPGPVNFILSDGSKALVPEGIFPNLLTLNGTPLTIPENMWKLNVPAAVTWPQTPEVSYNFYLQGNGTNNNSTFTMKQNSYLDGTYTLSVENAGPTLAAGQTYWDYVLQNPFQVNQAPYGDEYKNVTIKAQGPDGTEHNIITLDQTTGAVVIGAGADGTTPDEIALAILNSMSSYNYGSALVANLGVVTWGNNGYSVSTVDNLFDLNLIRPINVYWTPIQGQKWNQEPATYYIQDGLSVTNVTNSVAAGSLPTTTLTAAQYAWFNAYQLDLNITKSTYTVEGKTYDLSEYLTATASPVTPSTWYTNAFSGQKGATTSFTDAKGVVNECVSLWADASNVNAAGTPDFGGVVLSDMFVPSKTTTVTIPAALTYSWGSIFFNVTIVIEPYIFGN